ncbi:MAG: alpha/beta fold hydrolase [Pseudomonadota bacterium]
MYSRAPDGTAYELTGASDAPVVVLIHGLGLCRHLWVDHMAALAGRYRVLSYDLFGHGDSAPLPEDASLSVYAKQIADLMDHLQIEKAAIVGFSIGGMINRRFAMDFPDRASTLAILNSPHNRGDDAQKQVEERAMKVREQGGLSTLEAALKRWFTRDFLVTGNGAAKVREWREQVDAESYAQAAWVLANGVRELIAPQTPIDKPTLVITCENDSGSTPEMSRDIGAEIDGSETTIIPVLQHLGLMEDPDAFTNPILEFLERKYT